MNNKVILTVCLDCLLPQSSWVTWHISQVHEGKGYCARISIKTTKYGFETNINRYSETHLTLHSWVTYKEVIAMPCVVDGSHISALLYVTSYTCISQLFCHTYGVKVFAALKQDVWVSSYKHTDPSWLHIIRIIWLQQGNHSQNQLPYFSFRHFLH
jgi:hypothetical protein